MSFKDTIKSYINKIYRKDTFTNEMLKSVGLQLDENLINIKDLNSQLFFDTATEYGLNIYERDLGIVNKTASLSDRRQNVQANWTAVRGKKFALKDVQNICNSWNNGKLTASFKNGVILLEFNDIYGRPADMDKLLATIENIKPAHLPLEYTILYHTWGDISKTTWADVGKMTWGDVKEGQW